MEHPTKISHNFPKLSQFKGQPWSSLTTFLKESYPKHKREVLEVKKVSKKNIDTDYTKRSEMSPPNLSAFRGQSWSAWLNSFDPASLANDVEKHNVNNRVNRLPREDMGLFGICPENDRFCAVICSICGAVVKPQALQRHLELRHSTDPESALLPPPQVPVKKNKTANVKMKHKDVVPAAPVHSSENSVPSFQPTVVVKQIEMTNNTSSSKNFGTSKLPSLLTPLDSDMVFSNISSRKSPNINVDRKAQKMKDNEHETNKHTSVTEDSKTSCTRSTTCKSHLVSVKRTIIGRNKNLNIFGTEHNSSKEQLSTTKLRIATPKVTALPDISDSGTNSSQSSQPVNQDVSASTAVLPMQISPSSPALHTLVTCTDSVSGSMSGVIGTSARFPTSTCTSTTTEYQANSTGSDSMMTASFPSQTRVPTIGTISLSTAPLSSNDSVSGTSAVTSTVTSSTVVTLHNSTQLVRVMPVTSSPVYTVKLTNTNNPVIILNSKETTANCSANAVQNTASTRPFILKVTPVASDCTNEERANNTVQLPVLMQLPSLQDKMANVKFYSHYPKPIVLSTFSGKRVGGALVFSNSKRLEYIRNQFKSVLSRRARRLNATSPLKCTQSSASPSTLFGPKAMNANSTYRFSKATRPVTSNVQAASLLAHRPNILRTTVQRPTTKDQQMSKMLTATLKRPPQLASLDCKHILLKSNSNNINVNGIIGKMIVHPHEVTDLGDSPKTNHLALEKVVPMNIK